MSIPVNFILLQVAAVIRICRERKKKVSTMNRYFNAILLFENALFSGLGH